VSTSGTDITGAITGRTAMSVEKNLSDYYMGITKGTNHQHTNSEKSYCMKNTFDTYRK